MVIIKGEIRKQILDSGIDYISIKFSVDEICKGNTPYTNFYTFCLLHDLLEWNEYEEKYIPTIHAVDVIWSENDERNNTVRDMLRKLDIMYY